MTNYDELAREPLVIDLVQTRVRAHFYVGDVTYPTVSRPTFREDPPGSFEMHLTGPRDAKEPVGSYLVLVTPFTIDGVAGDEHAVRQRLASVVGLFVAMHGRNIAYERVFDNIYAFGECKTTVSTDPVVNPLALEPVTLDAAAADDLAATETAVELLDEPKRSRVRLSLRWHMSAAYDDGVDAVLKQWIALETLTMKSRTDIDSLVELLARAHEGEPASVKDELAIGKVNRLRGRIVHEGRDVGIDSTILDHMAYLYVDGLRELLDRPRWKRAARTAQRVRVLLDAALA